MFQALALVRACTMGSWQGPNLAKPWFEWSGGKKMHIWQYSTYMIVYELHSTTLVGGHWI